MLNLIMLWRSLLGSRANLVLQSHPPADHRPSAKVYDFQAYRAQIVRATKYDRETGRKSPHNGSSLAVVGIRLTPPVGLPVFIRKL